MRFLVNANLPPALARFLEESGHHTEHVEDIGLRHAKDTPIWDYAIEHNAVVIYHIRKGLRKCRNGILPLVQ